MVSLGNHDSRSQYLIWLIEYAQSSDWRGNLEKIDEPLSWKCVFCENTVGGMSTGWRLVGSNTSSFQGEHVGWVAICNHCHLPMFIDPDGRALHDVPYGRPTNKTPSSAAAVYEEARRCYAVSAFSAVTMLCRKLLMHVAYDLDATYFDDLTKEKKGRTPNFDVYVDWMDQHHYIPPKGKKWVDYLRTRGNDENHQLVLASQEEAKKLIDFAHSLLLVVYEIPFLMEDD